MSAPIIFEPVAAFAALGPQFSDPVQAAKFPRTQVRWRNERWAQAIGLGALDAGAFERHFALFEPLPDYTAPPLAMRYHGHQFGVYNPDLGDGRGFLFAQARAPDGRVLDLATKGSGQTPWSRRGDGRLTLKGAVREILAPQMLEALGVTTSKPFAVFETGEALQRNDEPSPTRSAVLTRLGHSHVRFGAFQRLAYLDQPDAMRRLVAHCAEIYYPDLGDLEGDAQVAGLFARVTGANVTLCATWMAAGFVHGVLNTDNMNVTGESFDYGPWRFLPKSDPAFTAAYFDEQGRYAFGRQPEALAWNLTRLAEAFATICPAPLLEETLASIAALYRRALRDAVFARLAIEPSDMEADLKVLSALFGWMTTSGVGWGQFFHDWFAGEASAQRALESPQASHYRDAEFAPVRDHITARKPVRPERLAHAVLQASAPPQLLIDDVEALWRPITDDDDWSLFERKIAEIDALRCALA